MTCVSGVISARVVVALGPRPVAMVGALLASAGLLAARLVNKILFSRKIGPCEAFSFARDLAALLTTYSLLAGLGFGLM